MKRFVVATLLSGSFAAGLNAKPPEAPTLPETEFRVLSPLAAEFHQSEALAVAEPFTPTVSALPARSLQEAFAGVSACLAREGHLESKEPYLKAALSYRFSAGSFFIDPWPVCLEVKTRDNGWKQRLARDVFDMAEAHRAAGDWAEARRWYIGVQELYPRTAIAAMAAERLQRYALLSVLAEAGTEQSEEPPMAGPERLFIMPRTR